MRESLPAESRFRRETLRVAVCGLFVELFGQGADRFEIRIRVDGFAPRCLWVGLHQRWIFGDAAARPQDLPPRPKVNRVNYLEEPCGVSLRFETHD